MSHATGGRGRELDPARRVPSLDNSQENAAGPGTRLAVHVHACWLFDIPAPACVRVRTRVRVRVRTRVRVTVMAKIVPPQKCPRIIFGCKFLS